MSAAEHQFNPSDLTNEQLDRIAMALYPRIQKLNEDRPMSAKEAYTWMGIASPTFYRLVSKGAIKGHRLTSDSDPVYLKSEIINSIKKS